MSARLKVKTCILVAIVVAGMVAMGAWVSTMQNDATLSSYKAEMKAQLESLPETFKEADAETQENTETFDAIYQSKADSVAFMAQNNAGYETIDSKMTELQSLLGVDNIFIVSRDGKVLAKSGKTQADFSSSRFNRLRAVLDSSEAASDEVVRVDLDSADWHDRYYSSRIDDNTMVVIEQSPEELDNLIADSSSAASILKSYSFGQTGFMIAVSAKDYQIIYHPSDSLVGADALGQGLSVESLEDGNYTWVEFAGQKLYCGIEQVDDTYYIAAVPEADLVAQRGVTTGVIMFVFFAVMLVVLFYGICVLRDEERRGTNPDDYIPLGSLHVNKAIARKGAVMSFVGFIAILVVAFYMQSLFALSSQSVANSHRAESIAESMQAADDRADSLRAQYSERYLNKCRTAAYILEHNSSLATKQNLQKLADVLQIQSVSVFDAVGNMTQTNTSYTNFSLSTDPNSQSYAFRKLLQGVEYVVQDAQNDDLSGELRQYIGVTMYDEAGSANGFVQIGIRPSRLENLLKSVQIENVIDSVKLGSDGFAFAVNKSDGTFAYYPESKLIGKDATACGMTAAQLKDGFCDYVTINGKTYYASAIEQGDYYLYAASNEGSLMASRGQLIGVTAVVDFVCQLLIFLILVLENRKSKFAVKPEGTDDDRVFDTAMPDGRTIRTESAASRWLPNSLKWDEKTPEQKVAALVKVLVGIAVLATCVAVVFKDSFFGQDSLFRYILGGTWERGLNIFALTASIMFACVAMTAATIVHKLLDLASTAMGSRGETVCRLLGSFIKYATIIGMVYYCLALLGVDTTTLLASAGILSIAISLGAKELVSDILSGLFIIFEGEFRVGDIITVGSWRGTVVEIGVRTTKVMDGSQNIKVIRNSNVSDVVNMTKKISVTSVDVGIDYDESLERVESILAKELPKMREDIPAIIAGPFYKGVVALGDSSVNIRIAVQCAESNRAQVERDLNRAVKLLFDHYGIGIPFPQVVVNQPAEKKEATWVEKMESERFNREQREAGKDTVDEHLGDK